MNIQLMVFGQMVQRDSVITVKFYEAVDVSSVIDTSNWRLNLGVKGGSVKPNMRYIVEYYSGTNFETFVSKDTVRDLSVINFNWDSPGVGVNSDNFKIVYEGLIYFPEDGNYWFRVEVDDIFKMWIDSVVSDSRAPVLVYAFGVQRDSVITVML